MDNLDPAQVASLDDLARYLQLLHLWADSPSLRRLEESTRHVKGVLPGTRLERVPLSRTALNDMLRGVKFPRKKAFLLTFVEVCGVDLEADRRWEQAWDRLAVQYVGHTSVAEAEQLAAAQARASEAEAMTEQLRQQLAAGPYPRRGRRGGVARGSTDARICLTLRVLAVALGVVTVRNSTEDAKRMLPILMDRAVGSAQSEIGLSSPSRIRAAFYCLDRERLVRKVYHAWPGASAPRVEFVHGRSEHDNEVIKFAHGESALLVKDLEEQPPPYFIDYRGRSYKSFVSVPVRADSESFGLLTADSDRALTESDQEILMVIASILGAGIAHVEAIESAAGGKSSTAAI